MNSTLLERPLEGAMRERRFARNDKPRRRGIESRRQVHGITGVLLKIPTEVELDLLSNRKSRESRRLVDDNYIVILMNDPCW
jgi:hypothetical protein